MGYQDIFLASADSTNRIAKEMGVNGAVHGSGVAADCQSAGRGRLGRPWHSPPGCNLYCSYVVRPAVAPEDFPKLTMVAGVAAVQCLRNHSSRIGLKWPNDLYIGARKCGGILCESSPAASSFAIIGLGINCNLSDSDMPAELQSSATSLLIEEGRRIDTKELYEDLRACLLEAIRDFEKLGFAHILSRWNRYDLFRGTVMTWVAEDGRPVEGTSLGPDLDGALLVEDAHGTCHKVISGDVALIDADNR